MTSKNWINPLPPTTVKEDIWHGVSQWAAIIANWNLCIKRQHTYEDQVLKKKESCVLLALGPAWGIHRCCFDWRQVLEIYLPHFNHVLLLMSSACLIWLSLLHFGLMKTLWDWTEWLVQGQWTSWLHRNLKLGSFYCRTLTTTLQWFMNRTDGSRSDPQPCTHNIMETLDISGFIYSYNRHLKFRREYNIR